MPTTKQLRVVVGDDGDSGLRFGDVVTIRGKSGSVMTKRVLTKYMELGLYNEGENFTRKVPMGTEINVLRTVLTEDEELDAELEHFAIKVVETADSVQRHFDRQVIVLNETCRDMQSKGVLYPFDLDRAATVAALQYKRALWMKVADLAGRNDKGMSDHRKILTAVMAVRQQCELDLTARYRNSLSRSTSVISNIEADLKLDAAAEFLKDTDWMGAEKLWERIG